MASAPPAHQSPHSQQCKVLSVFTTHPTNMFHLEIACVKDIAGHATGGLGPQLCVCFVASHSRPRPGIDPANAARSNFIELRLATRSRHSHLRKAVADTGHLVAHGRGRPEHQPSNLPGLRRRCGAGQHHRVGVIRRGAVGERQRQCVRRDARRQVVINRYDVEKRPTVVTNLDIGQTARELPGSK
jgi:hypothetical protein